MPDSKDDISALLALQAYKFNDKESPDIFNALSKVADSKTVMRRHSDVVRTVAINPGIRNWPPGVMMVRSKYGTSMIFRNVPKATASQRYEAGHCAPFCLHPMIRQ
jgi:hypothetical protein